MLKLAIAALLLLTGCAVESPSELAVSPTAAATSAATKVATAVAYAQPLATRTVAPSPIPTFTPTPTPTPLPTAVALTVTGDPRAAQLKEPDPNGRYPCGMVDVFDFPVDPPDAANVLRGGADFGVFRSRYDKFHAGEDWSGTGRSTALGTPVYSIGHGLVTYAQPLGWGRDQGVVIVEHTFEDGSRILSFYGHLDPDSVALRPGVCVARGEQVGTIGQPRTVPHLHFELRTQQPYAPLGGYWTEDPTVAGWLWPSQEVWKQRIVSAPGVGWTRPFATTDLRSLQNGPELIAELDGAQLLLLEAARLHVVDGATGETHQTLFDADDAAIDMSAAAIDTYSDQLVVVDGTDTLRAYAWPDAALGEDDATVPLWAFESDASGGALLPLPGGGVALASRSQVRAVSPEGELLWMQAVSSRPFDWQPTPAGLFWTQTGTDAAVWHAQGSEPPQKLAAVGGHLALADGVVWVAASDGIYRLVLDGEAADAEQVAAFAGSLLHRGDIVALPDGGALVAHADVTAGRLLRVAPDGAVVWQGALPSDVEGELWLTAVEDAVYLLAQQSGGAALDVVVYEVDTAVGELHRLFVGGTRYPLPSATWMRVLGDGRLLLNIGGGHLVAFDPSDVR